MIKTNENVKLSPKQAAAKMIWTAIQSYGPAYELDDHTGLYTMAGLDESTRTDREEGLVKVQFDKLSARVKKLLKVE